MSTAPGADGGVSSDELFLFDLNGYLVVRSVFSPDEVAAANEAIDAHRGRAQERAGSGLRNATEGTALSATGGRIDLGGFLGWDESPGRTVLRSTLAHRRLMPYFEAFCGPGYRLDHSPLVILQESDSEGFSLHGGTVDCRSGRYNPTLAYEFRQGEIHTNLLAASVILSDHDEGSGGFVVVKGSHKANMPFPAEMLNGDLYSEHIHQPATKAGDVSGARLWRLAE